MQKKPWREGDARRGDTKKGQLFGCCYLIGRFWSNPATPEHVQTGDNQGGWSGVQTVWKVRRTFELEHLRARVNSVGLGVIKDLVDLRLEVGFGQFS